jgi:hypothetical protein
VRAARGTSDEVGASVGGGAGRQRQGWRDGGWRSFAGVTRNHDSGLGFGSSLVQEIARMTGNSIEGLRRGKGNRRRRPVVRGSAKQRRACWCTGKAGEGERSSGRASSPPRGAFGVLVRRRGAAKRRHGELLKRGGDGGSGERLR